MTQVSVLAPARRRGLADEVADRIRDAIFSGVYAPGVQLREVELAEVMGVSRGPVREGLKVLEREGLVRCEWHRGATVTALTDADVTELDSLRGVLEDLAVRRLLDAPTADLTQVRAAADRMNRTDDEYEMVRLDIAFHDEVFAATGHQRLLEAWQALRCQIHLFLLTRINRTTDGYLGRIPDEHQELVDALAQGNVDNALELFARHRRGAAEVLRSS